MASVLDFVPIYQESVATIRARLDADLNSGLTPTDPRWTDPREGSFYYDITQVVILELARMWDALSTEVPASAFPIFAWGPYLDRHAECFGLERKPAVAATGTQTFTGEPGTVVATNTVVSATAPSEDVDPIEFVTTTDGVIGDQLAAPTGLGTTPSGTGGTLASATYYYTVTAYSEFGETDGSTEVPAVVTGPTGRVALDWNDVADADGYRVYRATATGGVGVLIYDGAVSAATDTGTAGTVEGPPEANTTAGIALPVEAVDAGTLGNVAARAVISLDSPNAGVSSVYNVEATTGGVDEETDEQLRARILTQFQGQGGGNITDYKRWALAYPGVSEVDVIPVWDGPGTVQVVIMADGGDPASSEVVDGLQALLDPDPGLGHGLAPVGVTVTVQTPSAVSIDVAATITFKTGYSLDGAAGTVATRTALENALRAYIDALGVGDDVVYDHVKAQFFAVEGVYTVSGVTVEGGTADITLTSDPPQVAQLATATLTEA